MADPRITLHLGDCLDVLRGLPDGSVDAVVTDPPYGARRPSARRSAERRFPEISGNDGVYADWLAQAFRLVVDGGAIYVFACWDRMEPWRRAIAEAGFRVRSCIVWDKVVHGLGDLKTCWGPQHEFILFGAKGRHELRSPRPKDVLRVQRLSPGELTHPYQKPTGVIAPLLKASTDEGDVILDPFMGSGTTGEACLDLSRNFLGIESDPDYFAIAERRIAAAREHAHARP